MSYQHAHNNSDACNLLVERRARSDAPYLSATWTVRSWKGSRAWLKAISVSFQMGSVFARIANSKLPEYRMGLKQAGRNTRLSKASMQEFDGCLCHGVPFSTRVFRPDFPSTSLQNWRRSAPGI